MSDIVLMIEEIIGHKLRFIVDKLLLRPTDESIIASDVSKLKRDTGWEPQITMKQTITDMINY